MRVFLLATILIAIAATTHAQNVTDCKVGYVDVLSNGDEVYPKAIRIWVDDTGFDLRLVGGIEITARQVLDCLSPIKFISLQGYGDVLRIEPNGLSLEQTYEKISTALLERFAPTPKRLAVKIN